MIGVGRGTRRRPQVVVQRQLEPTVTRVEDAGEAWRVFYNNRIYVETGAASHALAGNLPLLVGKKDGTVVVDDGWQA